MAESMESSNSPPDSDDELDGGGWVTPNTGRKSKTKSKTTVGASRANVNIRDIGIIGPNSAELVLIIEPTDDSTKEKKEQFIV